MCESHYKWNFPSNNHGQIFGIADSGVETFKGTPIKSLAREICQNSLDAKDQDENPTTVEFSSFNISPESIPDFPTLNEALERSFEFWKSQESKKAKTFFKKAMEIMKSNSIACLRISDYNTTGLTGSQKEYNSPWCNLTKSSGASDKSGSRGGSFGIGKFAPFACSSLRTVFYSTLDNEGISACQGIARLTSFRDQNNDITQGVGFYGDTNNSPVFSQIQLDPSFIRPANETGTDIYILGFNRTEDWERQLIASVLDGFLYAIYSNSLIVKVGETIISSENLSDLIASHKDDFKEHADEYYQALTDEKLSAVFTQEITLSSRVNFGATGLAPCCSSFGFSLAGNA